MLLADFVGPVARVLAKREARTGGKLPDLIDRLAEHVPDGAERLSFRQAVAHLA